MVIQKVKLYFACTYVGHIQYTAGFRMIRILWSDSVCSFEHTLNYNHWKSYLQLTPNVYLCQSKIWGQLYLPTMALMSDGKSEHVAHMCK